MDSKISKELSEQIEREAQKSYDKTDYYKPTGEAMWKKAYIAGATAYAHYKERWERVEANLKYISGQIGKIELNEQNIKLVQEANNAINFAMAGVDYTQTFSQNTLASWKDEGKDQATEGKQDKKLSGKCWTCSKPIEPETEGFCDDCWEKGKQEGGVHE